MWVVVVDGLTGAAMAGRERGTRRVAKKHAWLPLARHASSTLDACMLLVHQDMAGLLLQSALTRAQKYCVKGKWC